MIPRHFMGIDPGSEGSAAVLRESGNASEYLLFSSQTPQGIADWFRMWFGSPAGSMTTVYLEQVSSMPKQGVTSMFKFGRNLGTVEGILYALQVPFEYVTPQKWQTAAKVPKRGDKPQTEHKKGIVTIAQRRWPKFQALAYTKGNVGKADQLADGLLIADYARRLELGLLSSSQKK